MIIRILLHAAVAIIKPSTWRFHALGIAREFVR
jgi:hypothetical protein